MNRRIAPAIKPIEKISTGFPEKFSGINKIISEDGVFKLDIVYPNAGYSLASDKYTALAATDLILSGSNNKKSYEIAESIDALGGFVFKSGDYYNASVSIYGTNENLRQLLAIARESINACIFDQKELDIYKTKRISELKVNLDKTSFLANRCINQKIMGIEHPYAQAIDNDRINRINREALLEFKSTHWLKPYFIFTGSEDLNIESVIEEAGFEKPEITDFSIEGPLPSATALESFIEKKGSTQNSLRMGKILPSRADRDYFKISLLNLVLGGYFGSRLMKNIREEKGLTYGIHSSISAFRTFNLFKISCECNNQLSLQVKEEIDKELDALGNELIPDEELLIAKNYMCGAMLRNFDGAFNICDRYKSFIELNTEANYYTSYFQAIQSITPEELRETANNYLNKNTLVYCIAGER